MNEEYDVESPAAPKDTIPEVASCSASAPTVAMANGTHRNTQNTDALTAVSSDSPQDTPYTTQLSIESVGTPEHVHILALHREETPRQPHRAAPPSPLAAASANARTATTHAGSSSVQSEQEEVERLRREAARIKREQARLEEEIRLAKLQKEELEKHASARAEEAEEEIEIYCGNPIEVMSAITEEPRTLVLEKADVEVMSQITEARTEARHFHEITKKKRRWVVVFVILFVLAGIAAIVGGVQSKKGNEQSAVPANEEGKLLTNDLVDSTRPTASPTRDAAAESDTLVKPISIDVTETDHNVISTVSPTPAKSDDSETGSPTPSPGVSSYSTSPSFSAIYARTVKIQSNDEAILNVFEVQVFDSAGNNVAANKNATQSSTWEGQSASYAVDENRDTYSSTLKEERAWWQVDLEDLILIENVTVLNYYCYDESDQFGCLARLSNSTLFLMDDDDAIVASEEIGDTYGLSVLTFNFQATHTQSGAPSASVGNSPSVVPNISLTLSPSASPVRSPSLAPIQKSTLSPTLVQITQLPSLAPLQSGCSLGEEKFGIFFQFGADPTQISWYVANDCTGNIIATCDLCYENAAPYNSSAHHRCMPLAGYTFYFSDSAGDVWPVGSGFSITFNGESQSVQGSGGSLEDTSLTLGGDGSACPTVSPTSRTSAFSTTFDKLPFPFPYPYIRFTPWEMLGDPYILYAESLGYNLTLWDNPNTYDLETNNVFGSLDLTQQQDITNLGLNEDQWDCFMNHYESYRWESLPDLALQSLMDLGWSQWVWDNERDCSTCIPASERSNWRQLTAEEKAAAINLCWFRLSWDQDDALPW